MDRPNCDAPAHDYRQRYVNYEKSQDPKGLIPDQPRAKVSGFLQNLSRCLHANSSPPGLRLV
ncbi:hypothetical protein SBA4_20009 [Candidatus Sulfopaludibacter sp. SbA4]|nr:hypothetical protein SBA4_20009 [Candidatus Sulfopaludibacter sp. SbA4]